MTELDLYKFIEETSSDNSFDGEKAIIWVSHCYVEDFAKLIGDYYLDEEGVDVRLQEDCIAIDMTEICKDSNINMYAVFNI